MAMVLKMVDASGQLVTSDPQAVIVNSWVVKTVEVTREITVETLLEASELKLIERLAKDDHNAE